MKKYFLSSIVILLPIFSLAAPNPDRVGVCYLFNKDKLKSTGTCVVSTGTGAGGGYTNLNYKNKEYLFEYSDDTDDKDFYIRNNFYDRVNKDVAESLSDNEVISCYKHKPYDICYK